MRLTIRDTLWSKTSEFSDWKMKVFGSLKDWNFWINKDLKSWNKEDSDILDSRNIEAAGMGVLAFSVGRQTRPFRNDKDLKLWTDRRDGDFGIRRHRSFRIWKNDVLS